MLPATPTADAMSIGSHKRRTSTLRTDQSTDSLLQTPRRGSAITCLTVPGENSTFISDSSDMPYDSQLVFPRRKHSTSIVMERSRHIGAKLSHSNGNLNHVIDAEYPRSPWRNPLQYLRRKLSCCCQGNRGNDMHFSDPRVTITCEDGDNLSEDSAADKVQAQQSKFANCTPSCECHFHPAGSPSYYWSTIVCLAILYNYWIIIFRYAFFEITAETALIWLTLDYSMDFIYLLDILKGFRTAYLENGVLQTNPEKMRVHYKNSKLFYFDCLCLLPLDFVYLSIGYNSLLRIARLIKIFKLWKWLDITERHAIFPNFVRTCSMIHYLFLIFHWNACIFYIIMEDSTAFSNDHFDKSTASVGMLYVHSLYWSVMSLSTISHLPHPKGLKQYIYTTITMIVALLLFAAIMGMVSHIVSSMHSARKEFQATLDDVKTYMSQSNVPKQLQERVIRWFDYIWQVKKSVSKTDALDLLPERLKAEIAIHIHLETLKKVAIFQNTEAGFLQELVLRLEPVYFSPGDYVCRKGEVGKDMYIVKKGRLNVYDESNLLATIKPGGYFGEISILGMGEVGNRRTASVISMGYSDLFCLKKEDMCDVLQDYPMARVRLEANALQRLQKETISDLPDSSDGVSKMERQQQTVKPFNIAEQVVHEHPTLSAKTSVGSVSSRTVEALQIPEVKINHSPSVSRKESFLTNDVYLSNQPQATSLSLRSSARSMHSDVTRSIQSSNASLSQNSMEPKYRVSSPSHLRLPSPSKYVMRSPSPCLRRTPFDHCDEETIIVETST